MTEKHLFIKVPGVFLSQTKSYKGNTNVATRKRPPCIGTMRFIGYIFIIILLLPFFLINGRDNVKLNKVKRDEEPSQGRQ